MSTIERTRARNLAKARTAARKAARKRNSATGRRARLREIATEQAEIGKRLNAEARRLREGKEIDRTHAERQADRDRLRNLTRKAQNLRYPTEARR